MPIPSYSIIADNEIDPESPLTSSLMFRLRDNWMSVLGIDNTDPTPVFTIPSSVLHAESAPIFSATSTSATTLTSNEEIVSKIVDDVEFVTIEHGAHTNYDTNDLEAETAVTTPHFTVGKLYNSDSSDGDIASCANATLIDTIYSSGSPTGVRVVARGKIVTNLGAVAASWSGDVVITLANTWQTILTLGGGLGLAGTLQAKARSDVDNVYLQFRLTSIASKPAHIELPFARRSFKSKAAP